MMGLAAFSVCEESQAGGSLSGKAANKDRDFVAGHRRMMLDTSGRLTPSAMTILEGLACCHTRPSLPLAAQTWTIIDIFLMLAFGFWIGFFGI
jgi:hypothetical protein